MQAKPTRSDTRALPQNTTPLSPVRARWVPLDMVLRPASADDTDFLRTLYAQSRANELAAVPWSESTKRDFLDQQFTLQHQHYTTHFPAADFLIIEYADHAAGRLYLDRNGNPWHLIDIGLLAESQSHGLGSVLIGHVQQLAGEHGTGVTLHVQQNNTRAQALYRRLGFQADAITGHHLTMYWSSDDDVS